MTPTLRKQYGPSMMSLFMAIILTSVLWPFGQCKVWEGDGDIPGVREVGFMDAMPDGPRLDKSLVEKKRSWGYGPILSNLVSTIYSRRDDTVVPLENNEPSRRAVSPDDTHQFLFSLAQMQSELFRESPIYPLGSSDNSTSSAETESHTELRRRDGIYTVYISLSVCGLPTAPGDAFDVPTKGLDLIVSPGAPNPGSITGDREAQRLETDEGLALYVHEFTEDMHISVHAPALDGYEGQYTYEVTASIDGFHANHNDGESLFLVDRDHQAGLFTTANLTDPNTRIDPAADERITANAPFTIFVHELDDLRILALRKSYCGLENLAQINSTSSGVQQGIVKTGGAGARQQFYVPGLSPETSYHAILALPSFYTKRGAGVPRAGGMVWRSAEFATSTVGSCLVLSNLSFCDAVSYAAPSPANGSIDAQDLGQTYDSYASSLYQNFAFSLQQIPCDTTPEAQYSLATNCSNCAAAYKQWICAVTIPRCADTAANTSASIPRNASTSRNSMIQQQITPGTYNELPPCGGLCFGLMQNCPAALGFSCPSTGSWYFNQSYGYPGGNESNPTCNAPGTTLAIGEAALNGAPLYFTVFLAAVTAFMLG